MSAIVHSVGAGRAGAGFVAAMRWSVLARAGEKSGGKLIRQKAALTGATRYATSQADSTIHLGLYNEPVLSKVAPPKTLHSLALVFLAGLTTEGVDRSSINAALLMEPDGRPADRAIVIIEGGAIVRDGVEEKSKAIEAAREARETLPSIQIFAQTADLASVTLVSWAELQAGKGASTLVKALPPNTTLLTGLAAVAVVVGAGLLYNELVIKPEEARQRAIRAAAADQTASYVASLRAALDNAGWKTDDLQGSAARLDASPFYFAGWVLEEKTCTPRACVSRWKRQGGELPALTRLLAPASYDIDKSTLDVSYFTEEIRGQAAQLTVEQLPTMADAATGIRPILQRLSNAGIVVSSASPERWPPADFTQVSRAAIASRTPFELNGIPLPVAGKVIAELPPYAVLDGFTLAVSPGELAGMFKIKLKGYVYAK